MHSVEHSYAPISFANIWIKNATNQGDRPLRNAADLALPNPRTEQFKKSPLYSLPLEWNRMDDNKYIQQRTTFKTCVKYKLLNEIIDEASAGAATPPYQYV